MIDVLRHRGIEMEDVDRMRIGLLQPGGVGGVAVAIQAVELQVDEGGGQARGIAGSRHASHRLSDTQFTAEPADEVHSLGAASLRRRGASAG